MDQSTIIPESHMYTVPNSGRNDEFLVQQHQKSIIITIAWARGAKTHSNFHLAKMLVLKLLWWKSKLGPHLVATAKLLESPYLVAHIGEFTDSIEELKAILPFFTGYARFFSFWRLRKLLIISNPLFRKIHCCILQREFEKSPHVWKNICLEKLKK